jgi:hypothetical protein
MHAAAVPSHRPVGRRSAAAAAAARSHRRVAAGRGRWWFGLWPIDQLHARARSQVALDRVPI